MIGIRIRGANDKILFFLVANKIFLFEKGVLHEYEIIPKTN